MNTPIYKRVLEVLISLILILTFLPLFLIIAILIVLDSKGGIIYKSTRVGTKFKLFYMYKFRTMYYGADKELLQFTYLNQYNHRLNINPVFIKLKDDPRITKLGYFLRMTNLDELPQLYNILIGDMSFVGNRPLQIQEAINLLLNENNVRFYAPVGMTGLWQIRKRGGNIMMDNERIKLDNFYALKYSLWLDLWIIIMTIPALCRKSPQ